MKNVLIILGVILMLSVCGNAIASNLDSCDGPFGGILNKCNPDTDTDTWRPEADAKLATDLELGVMADAPNLVLLPYDLSLGIEGGKDLLNTNFDEGWFVYAKVTYTGSLLDFSKK